MFVGLHTKCLLFLSGFNQNRNFSSNFSKSLKYEALRKAPLVGVSFCAQGWAEGHVQPNSHASKSLVKKGSLRVQTGLILLVQDRC